MLFFNGSVETGKICRCRYGILIPSPSCTEVPLRRSGAGVAKSKESWEDTGAGAESYQELNLLLVVFL